MTSYGMGPQNDQLCQVKLGQDKLGQVRLGQVRLNRQKNILIYVWHSENDLFGTVDYLQMKTETHGYITNTVFDDLDIPDKVCLLFNFKRI